MMLRNVLLLLVILLAMLGAAQASHGYRKSFHCYRPFDSLSSFSLASMKSKDNCWLDYMRVLDAGVAVNCYSNGKIYATATSGDEAEHGKFGDRFGEWVDPTVTPDRNGCYATMFLKAEREGGHNNRGFVTNDDARYAVKLHTKGGGEVHYKGMDGIGYSACCMLLNQPKHSSCAWRNVTHDEGAAPLSNQEEGEAAHPKMEQYVEYCDLEEQPEDLRQEGDDPLGIMRDSNSDSNDNNNKKKAAFVGSVTKPLHRQMAGMWTMEVLFYRAHGAVGKVVSDFNVTHEMAGADDEATRNSVRKDYTSEGGEGQAETSGSVVHVKDTTHAMEADNKHGGAGRRHRNRKHHHQKGKHHHQKHAADSAPVAEKEEDLMIE